MVMVSKLSERIQTKQVSNVPIKLAETAKQTTTLGMFREQQQQQQLSSNYEQTYDQFNELFTGYSKEREEYIQSAGNFTEEEKIKKEKKEYIESYNKLSGNVLKLNEIYKQSKGSENPELKSFIDSLQSEHSEILDYETQAKQQSISSFESLAAKERYAYGDPRVNNYIDMERKRKYLIDTGERFTGTIKGITFEETPVYNVEGYGKFIGTPTIDYTESSSGNDERLTGFMINNENKTIQTYEPYYNKSGNRRLKLTDTNIEYKSSSNANFNQDYWNYTPRGYATPFQYSWQPPPSPNLKTQYYKDYPQLIGGVKLQVNQPTQVTMLNKFTNNSFEINKPFISSYGTKETKRIRYESTYYKYQPKEITRELTRQYKGGVKQFRSFESANKPTVLQLFKKQSKSGLKVLERSGLIRSV